MSSFEQGQDALRRGDFHRAEQIFDELMRSQGQSAPLLVGLGEAYLGQHRLAEAATVAQQAQTLGPHAGAEALMGHVIGRQGKRVEAEKHLRRATQMQPNEAYYWAVLGEQLLRQGRWQEGTDAIVRSLHLDAGGRAYRHVQHVVMDMVDAIVAGRIAETDGMKFVNQVDYTIPNKTQEMSGFFALARRSINALQPMPRPAPGAAPASHGPQQAPPPPPPPQQRSDASRPKPQGQPARRSQAATQGPRHSNTAQDARNRSNQNRPQMQSRPSAPSNTAARMESNQKDMIAFMQAEREQNESIQSMVPPAEVPAWPSENPNSIDQIAPIASGTTHSATPLRRREGADFRLTGGDIIVEIALERCLQNLLLATVATKLSVFPFSPASIPRIELNCRDGLLERLAPLESLYEEEVVIENYHQLALGKFIGECLVQSIGGTWMHEHPPERSVIRLGRHTLEPFEIAGRWLQASDPDDVDLMEIVAEALKAVATDSSFVPAVDYIDPTPGLEGEALSMKIAELWVQYRLSMQDADLGAVADELRIVSQDTTSVLFAMHRRWAPEFALGHDHAALTREQEIGGVYVREEGEFLLLGSRKHFARYLGRRFEALDADSAPEILQLLQSWFCPRWHLIGSDAAARDVAARLPDLQVTGPRLATSQNSQVLNVWAVNGRNPVSMQVRYSPGDAQPWQLQIL